METKIIHPPSHKERGSLDRNHTSHYSAPLHPHQLPPLRRLPIIETTAAPACPLCPLSPLLLPSSQPPSAADTQEQIFTNHTGNKTGKCKWKSVPDRGGLWRAARVGLRLCTGPKIRFLPGLLVWLSPSEHGS